jgi:hypothetical protein
MFPNIKLNPQTCLMHNNDNIYIYIKKRKSGVNSVINHSRPGMRKSGFYVHLLSIVIARQIFVSNY